MLARLAVLAALVLAVGGCAALPLAALGTAAVSGGTGGALRAGTERTFQRGAVLRTVAVPFDDAHEAALATLGRLGVKVTEEARDEDGRATIRGRAYDRSVAVALEAVTPEMTRLRVSVRRGLGADAATATAILAETERALEATPSVLGR